MMESEKKEPAIESAEKTKKTYRLIRGSFGGRTPITGQSVAHSVDCFGQRYDGKGKYIQYENVIEIDENGNLTCLRKFDDENMKDDIWINTSKENYSITESADGHTLLHINEGDGSYSMTCEKLEG